MAAFWKTQSDSWNCLKVWYGPRVQIINL